MRSEEEVQKLADQAADEAGEDPSNRYLAGVQAALEWVMDENDDISPLD